MAKGHNGKEQKNFIEYLKTDYPSVIYKENKSNWNQAEIIVSIIGKEIPWILPIK